MRSHKGSIDTTHTPPPLSFYDTFKLEENALTELPFSYSVNAERGKRKKMVLSDSSDFAL